MSSNLIYILVIIISLFLGCTTSPELKRDNESDPRSKDFKPNIGRVYSKLSPDKVVNLSWQDRSEFEDGFIIAKSISDNKNYVAIDTLSPNTISYTDSSKVLDYSTYYQVTSYSSNSDSLIGNSNVVPLNFGSIVNMRITPAGNDAYDVRWEYSRLIADRIVIEKFMDQSKEWVEVGTYMTDQNSIRITDTQNTTYFSVRISARITNFEDQDQEVFLIRETYLR